jgi:hypothetical protein
MFSFSGRSLAVPVCLTIPLYSSVLSLDISHSGRDVEGRFFTYEFYVRPPKNLLLYVTYTCCILIFESREQALLIKSQVLFLVKENIIYDTQKI